MDPADLLVVSCTLLTKGAQASAQCDGCRKAGLLRVLTLVLSGFRLSHRSSFFFRCDLSCQFTHCCAQCVQAVLGSSTKVVTAQETLVPNILSGLVTFFFGGLVRADSSISFCQPFLELLLGPHVMSPKHMTSVSSSKLQYVMFVVE